MNNFNSAYGRHYPGIFMFIVLLTAMGAGLVVVRFSKLVERDIDIATTQHIEVTDLNIALYREKTR